MSRKNNGQFVEATWIIGRIVLFLGSLGLIAWAIYNFPLYEIFQIFVLFVLIPMAVLTAVGVVSLETIKGLYQIGIMGKVQFNKIMEEEQKKAASKT